MKNKPLVTTFQLVVMAVGSALVFPYSFMPILTSPPANQDAWLALILAVVYIIILNAPVLFIINKFRGYSAAEAIELIMGKPAGKAFAMFYVLFFLFCSTACSDIMGQFIKTYLMPDTPFWAFIVFFAAPMVYLSYKGAGTIGRVAQFFVIFLMLTILLFFVFGIDKMDPDELKPILSDTTFLQLNFWAFLTAARYSEILILFVFSFYVRKQASIMKTYMAALSVFAVCFMLILLPIIMVLGDQYAKNVWSPYFVFARQVEAFGFITRVQAIFVIALIPVAIIKVTMYNYMASHVLAGALKLKTHRYFVIPFALITLIACLIPVMQKTSTFEFLTSDGFFPLVIIPIVFIIPIIMLIVYVFRRKKINISLRLKAPGDSDPM